MSIFNRTNIGNARVAGLERDLGLTGYVCRDAHRTVPIMGARNLTVHSQMYNIALSIFYICYALVEIPSNLILRKGEHDRIYHSDFILYMRNLIMSVATVGASIWIPTIIVSFGLVTTLTALVKDFGGLMAVRVMLGITEGGLMPAYLVVLSRFYTRSEMVLRTAFFASSATIAGMFGGALVSCEKKRSCESSVWLILLGNA